MDYPPTIIYHRADFDGIFSREIAKKKFGPHAILIGWDYGDPIPEVPRDKGDLYMIDISVEGLMDHPWLIWIDHHKSAIEKYSTEIKGLRIDGVAASRLAWQYFYGNKEATKEDYFERRVLEPRAVRLVGEYDIWDRRDPDADLFQHGLRSRDLNDEIWRNMLQPGSFGDAEVILLLSAGEAIQYAKTKENASIIKASGFDVEFEGLKFLACNAARYNSHLFTAGVKPEHDGLLGFNWAEGQWRISLYHAEGKEHHDLSLIATKYGGGGHRGACGFRVKTLPFPLT